jgi:hypothetical protein
MTNSAKFTITSSLGVEEVVLVQDPTTLNTIHSTINNSTQVHDITNACATADGTQLTGETRWFFFMEETVNLAISPAATPQGQATATLDISNYEDLSGSMSAADGAALVTFIKTCDLPPIP